VIISPLQERIQTQQGLSRLGAAYVDGLYSDDDYLREKRTLEDKPTTLEVPGVHAPTEVSELL